MQLLIVLLYISSIWASPLEETSPKLVPLKDIPSPRIINGERARLGQFPWQAALEVRSLFSGWFCGGTIISEEWILTAGHCVSGARSAQVYTGVVDLSSGAGATPASDFILHDGYNANTVANDIGLIRLSRALNFNENIQAIALSDEELRAGVEVTVSGWGITKDGGSSASQVLNYVTLSTISNSECDDIYGRGSILSEMVCAASSGNPVRSPCSGDSGGPLVTNAASSNPVHVAVVSFVSDSGCESGDPSGYTRTSVYRGWIRQKSGI